MGWKLTRLTRLSIVIGISFSFFLVEVAIGFKTHSIALIADAFHYLIDLFGYIVALVALVLSEKTDANTHKDLTYGWQRAKLLGAFFNGVFLLALGLSIFLQSIERFISLQHVDDPILIVIVGTIGLGLNIICLLFLDDRDHGHDHAHHPHLGEELIPATSADYTASIERAIGLPPMIARNHEADHSSHRHTQPNHNHQHNHHHKHGDWGMNAVMLHVLGDALNNVGVIIAGIVVWKAHSPKRFYVDPAISLAIALMIIISALPIVKKTGHVLLQSPPIGLDVTDIQHDLQTIPGVISVHELHVWRLNQEKSVATAHVIMEHMSLDKFTEQTKTINQCFHAYGIHSITIQPEIRYRRRPIAQADQSNETTLNGEEMDEQAVISHSPTTECRLSCGSTCEKMSCCG